MKFLLAPESIIAYVSISPFTYILVRNTSTDNARAYILLVSYRLLLSSGLFSFLKGLR